jgi:hypothetical protein
MAIIYGGLCSKEQAHVSQKILDSRRVYQVELFSLNQGEFMRFTERSDLHQNLGRYLRSKRLATGFTQSDIADKLGYSSPQFISNFERGLCSPPLRHLKALVKLYRLNPKELIQLIISEQKSVLSTALNGRATRH